MLPKLLVEIKYFCYILYLFVIYFTLFQSMFILFHVMVYGFTFILNLITLWHALYAFWVDRQQSSNQMLPCFLFLGDVR